MDSKRHIIQSKAPVRKALNQLNDLGQDLTLFVVDEGECLVGSLTDGDIRRGLLLDMDLDTEVGEFMNTSFKYVVKGQYDIDDIKELRESVQLIPEVNENKKLLRIINFNIKKSILPVDAMIMAGGKGTRLMPLTKETPKPLLKVGDKPIIEHNIDRLSEYGIHHINISIKYLGEQLVDYFGNGNDKGVSIAYTKEDSPLGTIGALSLVEEITNDHILVMNSDILTNIDFEDFFRTYIEEDADMAVATIPYKVKVPYAVLELEDQRITSFREKPTYTYYSNGGIYLMKKKVLNRIHKNTFYNATDLMEDLIKERGKLIQYPILGYWLDIGKHEDFKKAQEDIKHIRF